MKYERLTKRTENGYAMYANRNKTNFDNVYEAYNTLNKEYAQLLDRLAELEDKIEAGTLVELPCKVGDTVWLVKYLTCDGTLPVKVFDEWTIKSIVLTKYGMVFSGTHEGTDDFRLFDEDEYKVNWFTNREQAEARLKELRGVTWENQF